MPILLILIGMGIVLMMATKTSIAYVKGVPTIIHLSTFVSNGRTFSLRSDAASAFERMRASARESGIDLIVNSAFRSMIEQERLFELFKSGSGAVAAKPGFSNHQSGIAVDIETSSNVYGRFAGPVFDWLYANAWRFGFDNEEGRRVNEPWHWVYKGESARLEIA